MKSKKIERAFAYFPVFTLFLDLCALIEFFRDPGLFSFIGLLLMIYGIPLVAARLAMTFWPLEEGGSVFGGGTGFSPWLVVHRIQLVYLFVPQFERFLLAVPGLFSLWLRLWGSKIGKKVLWPPSVEVVDRTHMKVGNGVLIGNKVHFSPHVVKPKEERLFLYLKSIEIGDRAFIGAGSRLGPGCKVLTGAHVPVLTDLLVNKTYPEA